MCWHMGKVLPVHSGSAPLEGEIQHVPSEVEQLDRMQHKLLILALSILHCARRAPLLSVLLGNKSRQRSRKQ